MKTSILLALSLVFALPLHAKGKHGNATGKAKLTRQEIFTKKDKDHDGFLSLAEFTGKAKDPTKKTAKFNRLDTNGDNKLSEAEFLTKQGQKGKKGHKKNK